MKSRSGTKYFDNRKTLDYTLYKTKMRITPVFVKAPGEKCLSDMMNLILITMVISDGKNNVNRYIKV